MCLFIAISFSITGKAAEQAGLGSTAEESAEFAEETEPQHNTETINEKADDVDDASEYASTAATAGWIETEIAAAEDPVAILGNTAKAAEVASETEPSQNHSPEDFQYEIDEEQHTILLSKYTGQAQEVEVFGIYTVDGKEYNTILDSRKVFRENTVVTSVVLHEGIQFSGNTMIALFAQCSNLVSVDLTEISTAGITSMQSMFYGCGKLTYLDLSGFDSSSVETMRLMFYNCKKLAEIKGLESFDTGNLTSVYMMFSGTNALRKVDLSNWDMHNVTNSGWCFQNCYASEILLPDNIQYMSAGFMNHAKKFAGSSFTVPSGVKKIGYAHTFYDFATDDFTEFKVAEGNTNYAAWDGVLYSADGTEILAVPRNKQFEDNTYEIREGVTFIPELCFSRNYNLHKVIFPNSYVIRQYVPDRDPQYILIDDGGNLNGGNSLTIAFYIYTGVTDYVVKDDNPRYSSKDGIIYDKDFKTLIAVPARYDKLMDIPEGVERWETLAMWAADTFTVEQYMVHSPGVNIPSTMTDIADDEIMMLNNLNKYRLTGKQANFYVNNTTIQKYSFTFEIHVDENNPVYRTDQNGYLELYGFSKDMVTLSEESYVYDGTAKTPKVTVNLNGTELVEGTDFIVSYADNINAGTAKVVLTGIGEYDCVVEKEFTITPKAATPAITLSEISFVYNGKAQKPTVMVKDGDTEIASTDYDITWPSESINVGTYQVAVTLKGNYTGSGTASYKITEKDHKWNNYYTVDKKATRTEKGSESIHCSVCGAIKPDSIRPIPRLTGTWKKDSKGWWYSWSDGSYSKSKFENIGGKIYYFNSAGYMVTGWQYIGGKWYYFNGDGAMQTGWRYLGGVWYYLNGSGVMVTGWQNIGDVWYYFNGSGAMQTGWQYIGGKWYYFNGDGAMQTGWKYLGGVWYYLNGSGVMLTGWQKIGGTWYYFDGSGAMAANIWVGDYYLTGSGAMATNTWIGSYYVGSDGKWIPGYKAAR